MTRHNNYNHYLGELTISDFPEGSLTTVNNKSGIDPDDENWDKVFVALGNHNGTKPVGASNDAWKESQYEMALVDKFTGAPGSPMSRDRTLSGWLEFVWIASLNKILEKLLFTN